MKHNNLNCLTPPEVIFLPDGTELRLCTGAVPRKGHRKLYCSCMGIFYSLSSRGLNQVQYYRTKNFKAKPNVHSNYPRMCNFKGAPYCHLLVAYAWLNPGNTDKQLECHHLNGDLTDFRASNLIWLSPEDHRRFDAALRQGIILTRQDPDAGIDYELTHHMDF